MGACSGRVKEQGTGKSKDGEGKGMPEEEELEEEEEALRDPADSRFMRSFSVEDGAGAGEFFRDQGFVVFRNVFSADECEKTRDAMWSLIEQGNPGFVRDDQRTWDEFKATGKYGLGARGPVFHPQLVRNRQNPNLSRVLSTVLGVAEDDVMVSHDRYTIYRATHLDATLFGGSGSGNGRDGSRFRTGRRNVHLDLNPWWWLESSRDILVGANSLRYSDAQDFVKENNLIVASMGPHVQCVLNFADNLEQDGGTLVVPRFHARLREWSEEHAAKLRKPVPFVTFGNAANEAAAEAALLTQAKRVPMREGSVLVWNQTVMHGTEPNDSANTRHAQFIKAFSRAAVFAAEGSAECEGVTCADNAARLRRRAEALRALLAEAGAEAVVSPAGARLFGLDVLA